MLTLDLACRCEVGRESAKSCNASSIAVMVMEEKLCDAPRLPDED